MISIKNTIKIIILLIINLIVIKHGKNLKINISELNKKYLFIQKKFNLSFSNNIKQKIRIGIFCFGIKNGGVERLVTLLN